MKGGLHLGCPLASIFFLFLILIVALFIQNFRARKKALASFAHDISLKHLLRGFSSEIALLRIILICLVWALVVTALIQPRTIKEREPKADKGGQENILDETLMSADDQEKVIMQRRAHDVIFLIDASASMSVHDTRMNRSRLDYAKEIIDEIVSQLDGQSTALYAFTSELTPLVPPTMDYYFLRLLLRKISINEGDVAGTDLLEALDRVRLQHLNTHEEKLKTLIILTDGGDTRLEAMNGNERQKELSTLVSRLGSVEENNLRVFTIGMGSKEGEIIPNIQFDGSDIRSTLDEELLQLLSQKGRGQYYFANDYSAFSISQDLMNIMRQDNPYVDHEEEAFNPYKLERELEKEQEKNIEYFNYYQIPLGLAILLLSLEVFWPLLASGKEKISIQGSI